MIYHVLAKALLLLHLLFVLFVVIGGVLVLYRRKVAWVHIPAAAWGIFVELSGWICPLTPLENLFRANAHLEGYQTGFIEHVIVPVIYPAQLTRHMQVTLGLLVLMVNLGLYGFLIFKLRKKDRGNFS